MATIWRQSIKTYKNSQTPNNTNLLFLILLNICFHYTVNAIEFLTRVQLLPAHQNSPSMITSQSDEVLRAPHTAAPWAFVPVVVREHPAKSCDYWYTISQRSVCRSWLLSVFQVFRSRIFLTASHYFGATGDNKTDLIRARNLPVGTLDQWAFEHSVELRLSSRQKANSERIC